LANNIAANLKWSEDSGDVTIYTTEVYDNRPIGTVLFSSPVTKIQRGLLADGSTGIYLWVNDKRYYFYTGPELGGSIARAIVSTAGERLKEVDKVDMFYSFLVKNGVMMKRTNLAKVLVITIVSFFAVLAVLIIIALNMVEA
jgi:sensor histidine kinase YesM